MALRFPSRSDEERPYDVGCLQPEPDEVALVDAARADPQAFSALYERYLGPVYRYCFVRLGDRAASEDATGETFVKALAALPNYRGGLFAAWLFRIAHNVVVDAQRRRQPTAPLESAGEPADHDPTPEDIAVSHDVATALRASLARLSDDQRAVIELQLADWSQREIAATLGKSPAAVKMLRLRALGRLKALLVIDQESTSREVHDD